MPDKLAPDWIISTKLAPPRLPGYFIDRERLLEKFQENFTFTLSLIHAPAGYGKTVLLKQWYDIAVSGKLTTAWLSLDDDDNELEIFSAYLAAALEKAGLPSPALNAFANRSRASSNISRLAASFINTVSSFDATIFIFLDDYHKIIHQNCNSLIKTIAKHAPENLHLIIASRKTLAFSVESFRASHNFNELSSADLKLTLPEFETLLTTEISPVNLRYVWDRIEGWPIAARIVNHTLETGLISAEDISNFSGKTSDLGDYISDEIFSSLGAEEKSFLLTTCLSSRFNAELADRLCDTGDSYNIIERLKKMDLFLVALDSEDYWYRYHQLFQQYLIKKIQSEHPEKITEIRTASALWFYQNGYFQEAIEQALLSNDFALAGEIIDSIGLWRLTIQGKISLATTYLSKLPVEVIEKYPSLIVMHIFMHTKAGDIGYAKNKRDDFLKKSGNISHWQGKPIDAGLRDCLTIIVTCLIDTYLDKPIDQTALDATYQLVSRISPDDPIFLYTLHECLGHHRTDMAEFDNALAHHQKSLAAAKHLNSPYAEVYIYFHRAEIYFHRLELDQAGQELQQAATIVHSIYKDEPNLGFALSVFQAKACYLQYAIDDAFSALDNSAADINNVDSWITLYLALFEVKVGIEISRHNYTAAMAVLDQAETIAEDRLLIRLTQFAKITRIKLILLQNNRNQEQLNSLLSELETIAGQLEAPLSRLLPSLLLLTKARLLLHLENLEQAEQLLNPLIHEFKKHQQNRLLVEACLLKSLAMYLRDNQDSAREYCQLATALCLGGQYKGSHLENAQLLRPVYQLTAKTAPEPQATFLKEIIKTAAARVYNSQRYGLTEREYHTVRELAKGLSNREIAENICVSEDTVKYRLKSIFKKWEVTSRDEAISKAIQLQLDTDFSAAS